jgi:hypothetical protein
VEVELARNLSIGEQSGQLRGEAEDAVPLGIEERLLAEPIAGHQEPAATRVPEGEGEHALELPDAVGAELLVEVDDHLGVAVRPERVAAAL